ncbi:EF-hand domain-containing protein [Bowmanella dokdonensis]|uniref:EF-hand domain-containing protein n=1 Tax=Bowmanella dokdonensis TaxID=751969 RepID=A0A939DPG4_9ALTE|nr:EF-hand domain-containing protein [Bowmanella dokdonensis]MBN7826268.1 EF-hand domain-containing protein [Bowmanella dokdonensis]
MKKFAFVLFLVPAMGAFAAGDLFSTLDKDGNGSLSATEAAAESRLSANFDKYDTDGNGEISRSEFSKYKGE